MKTKSLVCSVIVIALLLSLSFIGYTQPELSSFSASTPIAITTCGQSPGALMAKLIMTRAGLANYHDDLLTAEYLAEKAAQGEGFKALVITTGTSMKGMGAAGTDINDEIPRINKLIAEAKKQGIFVIGAHIEGSARRVDHSDALSIETVCTQADLLMVIDSSDEDGYFTKLAADKEIPLMKAKEALHLIEPLKTLFMQ